MRQKMIQLLVLIVCANFLTSCKFDWRPDPHVIDYQTGELVSTKNERISCMDERIVDYTCFDSDNIAELASAIKKCEKNK